MPVEYLKKAFDPISLKKIATFAFKMSQQVDAEIIVARGLSGTIIAAAVASEFGMPFAIVRKPTENGHSSGFEVTEHLDGYTTLVYCNYLIVDDFIVSGSTMKAIEQEIRVYRHKISGNCKGIVLYNEQDKDRHKWPINGVNAPIYRMNWNE